jgi:hypothetical protein
MSSNVINFDAYKKGRVAGYYQQLGFPVVVNKQDPDFLLGLTEGVNNAKDLLQHSFVVYS